MYPFSTRLELILTPFSKLQGILCIMKIYQHLSSVFVLLLYTSVGILGQGLTSGENQCSYPSLLNATSDQLQDGLEKGCFTSVRLIQVC